MQIDLKSDTVTKPTAQMLQAMVEAEVGDDVFGEDPTVNALEEKSAKLFGKEAAMFCPSGTMTNQIAIKILTQPGDEVICDKTAHIYLYEGGGIAYNSGCSVRLLEGQRGQFTAEQVEQAVNVENIHFPRTSMVSIENTSNKGGGSIWDFAEIQRIKQTCNAHNLKLHLDGARIFNALVETGQSPGEMGAPFDTISVCLSKGLGAPVGSVLIGSTELIREARRKRKVLGGGMRQAGFLAAACIYALDNNVALLKDDHRRARQLGEIMQRQPYVTEVLPLETNIVVATLEKSLQLQTYLQKLQEHGLSAAPFGAQQVRFVTHLQFTDDMLQRVEEVVSKNFA